MSDPDLVQQRYAEVSYPGGAFAHTHPARLAAIAGLFGLETPPVRTARVLELGCAQGYNLLPMAAHLPEARFTGVDFSEQEIARGRQLAHEAGLDNVQLLCADLRTFTPEPGSFDFIIAHGVLSWVPDDVKEALFAVCARALAPDGLALISYNTYPGWKQREAVRELMLLRSAHATDAAGRLAAARSALDTLENVLTNRTESHAALNREIIASMRKKQTGHFYHDDLDGVNDPCYFLQFTDWASEHGLTFVAEAANPLLGIEQLPPSLRTALAELPRLQIEQHLDFAINRTFRSSILCHAGRGLATHPDPAALNGCCFGSPLAPSAPVGPGLLATAGEFIRFGEGRPHSFQTNDPVTIALFAVLSQGWPKRFPYLELHSAITRLFQEARGPAPAHLDQTLPITLLLACARQQLDYLTDCGLTSAAQPPAKPDTHPLTRLMASQGLPVVNAWHEMIHPDPPAR